MDCQVVIHNKSQEIIDISESEYELIYKAWQRVLDAGFIEQKFSILLENYLELEYDISLNIINGTSWNEKSWNEGVDFIHHCNRRVLNLLTTCRAYLDHTRVHLRTFNTEEVNYKKIFNKLTNNVYKDSFSYRLLEVLRNHSQHYDVPLNGTQIKINRISTGEPRLNEHNLELTINSLSLLRNEGLKLEVAEEIIEKYKDASFDLRPHIYEYVLGLSEVHTEIREKIENKVLESIFCIEESIQKFCQSKPENCNGFSLKKESEQNIEIFYSPISRWKKLIQRTIESNLTEKSILPLNKYNQVSVLAALKIQS